MAETNPAESSLASEVFDYTVHHPIKALGNTAVFLGAVHLAREWRRPLAGFISRQLESRRQMNDEVQDAQQTEQ